MKPLARHWTRSGLLVLLAAAALPGARALGADSPDVRAAIVAPTLVSAGSKTTLTIAMTISPAWHVNSHTPSEAYLIPTDVILSTSAGTLSSVRYPLDLERRLPFDEKPLRLYEGTVSFTADLELPAAERGRVSIAGSVIYQACNDRQCFPPARISLETAVIAAADAPAGSAPGPALEASLPSPPGPPPSSARPAEAPETAAPGDLALRSLDGTPFSLDSLRGQLVVLDFWASWCLPCQASFPFLNGLQAKYGGRGLRVVGLTLEDNSDAIFSFLDSVPATFSIVRDPSGRAGDAFRVVAMPTTFLLDRGGRIVARFEGGDRRAHAGLEAAIAALVSGAALPEGTDVRIPDSLKATSRVKAWQRARLADPIMNLDGDPLTRLLHEHIHASKEGAAGDGGAAGGGCGCN